MPNPVSATLAASAAIDLGWRLAQLYNSPELPGPPSPPAPSDAKPLPPHLPGASEMSAFEKAEALIGRIDADIEAVGSPLGPTSPTTVGVRAALNEPTHAHDVVRSEIKQLYDQLRNQLSGRAPILSTAFGLGRMLADTVLLPTKEDGEVIAEQFGPFRLSNAYFWLLDLETALPAHSATAVQGSLRCWEEWVAKLPRVQGKINGAQIDESVIHTLHRQGEMWRRLLTGEKDPLTLLEPDDYVRAASALLRSFRRIVRHFVWQWLLAIIFIVAVFAAAIWAAVTFAPAGADRVAAFLVSVAGALGLTWKGLEGTLGRAIGQAQSALWNAEVTASVTEASTITPPGKR